MALPKSFTDLEKAYNSMPNTVLNIIGVVVDLMSATMTAKGQYMQTFKLLDPKLRDSVSGNEGLRVRFFKEDPLRLPEVKDLGDVVLLRNIKTSFFQGQPMALSNYQTEVTVVPVAEIPAPGFEIAFQGKHRLRCLGSRLDVTKMTLEEQSYIIQLKHDLTETVQTIASNSRASGNLKTSDILSGIPTAPAAMRDKCETNMNPPEPKRLKYSKKFRLISELRHREFADIIVQVVKKFPTHVGTCELYVTDYTENKEMFYYTPPEQEDEGERDGDTFGYTGASKRSWPGPYEWFVLKVNTREPHAHYANTEVREGDFILLKNVKIKVFNHLEGDMWPDDWNPGEAKISKLKNFETSEVSAILERKERYWASRNTKLSNDERPKEKKPTKAEKKKQKKQRKTEQAVAANEGAKSKTVESISGLQNGANKDAMKADLNPHVRCTHQDVPISSVKAILDPTNEKHTNMTREGETYVLPFVNVKHRARMRVVDYEPKTLEEFALPKLSGDGYESEDTPMVDYESSPEYEWSFSLLLEDACKPKNAIIASEDQTWVNVHHEHAQHLFGNDMDDPKDLYTDQRLLSKLREKLCILWGNLEEKKDDQPLSNRPFECCLTEYGIEMDDDDPQKASQAFGWIRMYSMEGVTIS